MNKRNQGIDLLKILSMFGIVFMHVIVKGGVLDLYNTSLSKNSIFWIFECLFCCSVDCFGLISGYLVTDNSLNFTKIIKLWFQVIFYSFFVDVILYSFGLINDYSIKNILIDLTPIISQSYWYFNAYIPLCIFKGYIKDCLDLLSDNKIIELFILLFVLYCTIGLIYDPFNVGYGYTPLWITVLFIFGYIIKKCSLFNDINSKILIIIFACCTLFNWLSNTFITGVILNYNSPTVLVSAICLLVVFSRIKVDCKIIPKISILTFGVYLFHENSNISKLLISDRLLGVVSYNPIFVILLVLLYSLAIFKIGLLVEYVRNLLFKFLKVDKLVCAIEKTLKNGFNKFKGKMI